MLTKDPKNPRFVVEPSPEATETFMGPMEVLDLKMLESPAFLSIFEPGQLSMFIFVFESGKLYLLEDSRCES